jgi:hypothetical protein
LEDLAGACNKRFRFSFQTLRIRKHAFAISRLDMPEVCQKFPYPPKTEGAGNAGCALHPQPRVRKKAHALATTGTPHQPAFPAQWF